MTTDDQSRPKRIANMMLALLEMLPQEERGEVLSTIERQYCFYCGSEGEGPCYCTYDPPQDPD